MIGPWSRPIPPKRGTPVSSLLCEEIQVKGGEVLDRQFFGRGGGKAGNHFKIAMALVAHLHPDILAPAFRGKDAEKGGVLVAAVNTL
jgi:hypothetical protein